MSPIFIRDAVYCADLISLRERETEIKIDPTSDEGNVRVEGGGTYSPRDVDQTDGEITNIFQRFKRLEIFVPTGGAATLASCNEAHHVGRA